MRSFFTSVGIVVILASTPGVAVAQVSVDGYFRNDGRYVQPHQRTTPNNSLYDNYSTRPNVNPWSGQTGTVSPYATPSTPSYSYGSRTPSYNTYTNPYGSSQPRRW